MSRSRILILTYTQFDREPRALKQVRYLRHAHTVTTAGFGPAPFDDLEHIEIPRVNAQRWGILGRLMYLVALTLRVYRLIPFASALDAEVRRLLADREWDIVIAHDFQALDAAESLVPRHGVVLDLHEYAPRQNEHSRLWRWLIAPYFRWLCRTRVPSLAAVVTVGNGIAAEYRREFGWDSTVVVNATPYYDLQPGRVGATIRLVHSGIAATQRRLDLMIDAVRATSADVTLDFYLVEGGAGQLERLRVLAGDEPRIRFRDPVPYDELISTLNAYDVGLSILPPTTFNLEWCLPNKFFDFIQARLGIIVGPSPEMSRLVDERKLGAVLPDFESTSLTALLDSLTANDVQQWKAASNRHAEELSSERQASIWCDLVDRVLA